jgi:hypothetical protein
MTIYGSRIAVKEDLIWGIFFSGTGGRASYWARGTRALEEAAAMFWDSLRL